MWIFFLSINLIVIGVCTNYYSQNLIVNGSFEGGTPKKDTLPPNWQKCHGNIIPNYSTPDLMPGSSNVNNQAQHGSQYLNLVCTPINENHSERAFGICTEFLTIGKCYEVSCYLMMSSTFYIDNGWLGIELDFSTPIRFNILMASGTCFQLGDSIASWVLTDFDVWTKYTKYFTATDDYKGIKLASSYYQDSNYHGHVLIDNLVIREIVDSLYFIQENYSLFEEDSLIINSPENMYFVWDDDSLCNGLCNELTFYFDSAVQYFTCEIYDSTSCFHQRVSYTISPAYYPIDSIAVVEEYLNEFKFPNVITPNQDSFNEHFPLPDIGGHPFSFRVYNRWGNIVFRTNNQSFQFDGSNLSDGVYYYIYECSFYGNEWKTQGVIHVLR